MNEYYTAESVNIYSSVGYTVYSTVCVGYTAQMMNLYTQFIVFVPLASVPFAPKT